MLGKVDGRWGPCTYFLKDEYVGRSVRNYGEYNPDETEKILDLVASVYNFEDERSNVVLDIGANIGCISQAIVAHGYNLHFFEPQPEVFEVCSTNVLSTKSIVDRGGYIRSTVSYKCALGSAPGIAKMPKVAYSDKGNFGGLGIGMNIGRGTYDVPVDTLDNKYSLDKCTMKVAFIKMDVEGFELEVLKGGTELIKRDKPVMYIEDDRSDKSYALRKYIREELGYWIEEHKPPLYREKNFFGLERNVWDKNYASHNIICRPC